MKRFSRLLAVLILVAVMIFNIASCIPSDSSGDTDFPNEPKEVFYITGDVTRTMKVGDTLQLDLVIPEDAEGTPTWTSSHSCAAVNNGTVTALSEGTAVIKATLGNYVDRVTIQVIAPDDNQEDTPDNTPDNTPDDSENNSDNNDNNNNNYVGDIYVGENGYIFGSEYDTITIAEALIAAEAYKSSASTEIYYVVAEIIYINNPTRGEMMILDNTDDMYVYRSTMSDGSSLSTSDIRNGDVAIIAGTLRNYNGILEFERATVIAYFTPGEELPAPAGQGGNTDDTDDDGNGDNNGTPVGGGNIVWPTPDDPITEDPYVNVDVDAFYANYQPAISYMDAYYRSLHNLMSGEIADQDQAPTVSAYQPTEDGLYLRNTAYLYSEDGNTYFVVDAYGEVVGEIYRGGAYVMLEEVAAYVFAFGTPPANHSQSKSTSPAESPWGIFLRVNHTKFTGDTYRYPYEPELPNISGCGGDLIYYEMDIGTTGTDCDPSYPTAIYNNGTSITRGAARIVYTRSDADGDGVIEPNETYLFYTHNHYNDFQEYLNYEGGWGEMFGNVTGGGTISSKSDYNPTPYVSVVYAPFVTVSDDTDTVTEVVVFILPKREET